MASRNIIVESIDALTVLRELRGYSQQYMVLAARQAWQFTAYLSMWYCSDSLLQGHPKMCSRECDAVGQIQDLEYEGRFAL